MRSLKNTSLWRKDQKIYLYGEKTRGCIFMERRRTTKLINSSWLDEPKCWPRLSWLNSSSAYFDFQWSLTNLTWPRDLVCFHHIKEEELYIYIYIHAFSITTVNRSRPLPLVAARDHRRQSQSGCLNPRGRRQWLSDWITVKFWLEFGQN